VFEEQQRLRERRRIEKVRAESQRKETMKKVIESSNSLSNMK